jgi:cytochrome c-type biogenesis protein CcmH/NrfF
VRFGRLALLVCAFLVAAGAFLVAAGTLSGCEERAENAEQRAQNLTRSVMSPFCPGRTLDTCPSPKAGEWRADIHKWVNEGVSNDEIRRRLYARTPDVDLTGGPNTGVGSWFPVTAAAAALGLLVFVLRRLSRAQKPVTPSAPKRAASEPAVPDDAALEARLDDELKQND